jgi:hypothetical protein
MRLSNEIVKNGILRLVFAKNNRLPTHAFSSGLVGQCCQVKNLSSRGAVCE